MAISEGYGRRGTEFRRQIEAQYVLAPKDEPPLHEACKLMDEITLLENVLANAGPMALGSTGQPVVHPALAALRAHRVVLERMLTRLGGPDVDGAAAPSLRGRAGKTAAAKARQPHRRRATPG